MTFLTWVVRVLVVLLLIRLAVQLFRGALGSSGRPTSKRSATKPPERIGGALVKDPQCGTFVPKDRAIVHGRGDAAEYFCSTSCRDQWLTGATRATGSGRV